MDPIDLEAEIKGFTHHDPLEDTERGVGVGAGNELRTKFHPSRSA